MLRTIYWLCVVFAGFYAAGAQAVLPIQHWQAASGAQVYFVENHDLPMIDLSIDFPAGSGYDSKEKAGLAALTQHALKLGAAGLSEDEIAKRVADVGAMLGGRFDFDRAGLSLRTLSSARERDQALDVMQRMLQLPEFPADAVEREKARIVSGIKEEDTKPESISDRAFYQMIYGAHPYALRSDGEVDTVAALTRDDLLDFYRRHYLARNAVVAIMGDISRQEAERIVEGLTAALPKSDTVAVLPAVTPLAAGEVRKIPHPASQSHILLGAPGVKRSDPDYYALYVGNYILGGGGFASRLTEEVREKRGYAYSVYSYFMPLQETGPFQIGLQTKKEQAEQALKVVHETLHDFLTKGPTAQELEKAKQNIVNGFALRIDSNKKIQEYLSAIGFYKLPLNYLDTFIPNIEKVSLADIRAAFKRHLDPDRMVTVIVGAVEEQNK
ncbi:MAG: pitrilysin family protein [Pseudomonadota bacterium]